MLSSLPLQKKKGPLQKKERPYPAFLLLPWRNASHVSDINDSTTIGLIGLILDSERHGEVIGGMR